MTPTKVDKGYYSLGVYSLQYNMQVDDDSTTRDSQAICEPGYYCIKGLRAPCAPGRYGDAKGLTKPSCSGLCAPGYLCALASTSAKQLLCSTGPGEYCPLGSYQSLPVPSGYYSVNGTLTSRSAIVPCSPGTYCVGGVTRKCPAGRYSAQGSDSELCDGLCDSGYYCLEGSLSPKAAPCPAGRYGTKGMPNALCKGECIAGYYCPETSTRPYEYECGDEYHYCPAGSAAPLAVDSGSYSSGQNATIRMRQEVCKLSVYYSSPPSGEKRKFVCPDTTAP